VYPGEALHLHIFEPRYKQLINECFSQKKPFGIPVVINDKLTEIGTLLEIKAIEKIYDDGQMDIKTKGISVFKILEVIKEIPQKLFSGAIVNYPANNVQTYPSKIKNLLQQVQQLHLLLQVNKDFKKPEQELLSYDLAHHVGFNLQQEYELLQLFREDQRLEYIKRYVEQAIALLQNMEGLKQRIQLNGHFKELKGFNLQ
jgi:Lon protease-like protein